MMHCRDDGELTRGWVGSKVDENLEAEATVSPAKACPLGRTISSSEAS